MDDLDVQGPELEQTLSQIEFINRTLGGYGPSLDGLAALCPEGEKTITVLDVGTGGGDTPRRMVDWGRRRGLDVRVTAIDLSETTVEYARARSTAYPEIDVRRVDLDAVTFGVEFDD